MIGRRRSVRIRLLGAAVGIWLGACASSPLRLVGERGSGRFEHVEIGYRIAYPALPRDERWSTSSIEGADLSFRGPRGDQMALLSDCRETEAEPNVLSRNLTLGFRDQRLLASRPVSVGRHSGWERIFDTSEAGPSSRVKTVTIRADDCTFDWIFVTLAGERFQRLEPAFDEWIASFEAPGERPSKRDGREDDG